MTRNSNSGAIGIAIEGRYLDEVQIRQAKRYAANCVGYRSFPAHRHSAHVEGDVVMVSAQAPTVVVLLAGGVLPPVAGRAVKIQIGGRTLGPLHLEAIESGETDSVGEVIVLRFRCPSGPPP